MNIIDTPAWLEYFSDGPNARHFSQAIENTKQLLVPAVCVYEVFKKILRERGEAGALQAAALMSQGEIMELDLPLALSAAKISIDLKIPMADSIILAAAKARKATIWTQDADFQGLPGVKFFAK